MANRDKDLTDRGAENQVEGSLDELKGKAKNTKGAVTGDTGDQIEGKAQELGGKIKKGFGKTQQDADREL